MKLPIAFVMLSCAYGLQAQDHVFFKKIAGAWSGEGSLFGRAARFSMVWEDCLDGKFTKLRFENEIVNSDRAFSAEAFYRLENDSTAAGHWFDNRGYYVKITASVSADSMVSLWEAPAENGKTVYTIVSGDEMKVEDYVWKNGAWVAFGQAAYRKE